MTIHVVGLGPGAADLLTAGARALLDSGLPVILRTRHHPTVAEIAASAAWESCDDLYAGGAAFAEVYDRVARRVLDRAATGDLVFAVPGHPLVAEASVERLLALAAGMYVEVRVHPAVSFVDLAAVALGRDLGAIQVCDALALRIDAQRPALVGQVYDRDTAARLKVDLLEIYPAEHPVTLLQGLGSPAERVTPTTLAAIDHVAWGYLDSVYIPPLAPEDDVRRFDGLHAIVHRLHAPGGCPWDREQTHVSLRHYLVEETYEVLEAIDAGDPATLAEELGDLLLQVLMHTSVAEREDTFAFANVSEHLARKLIRRHPHVFGDATASTAANVYQRWDELKKAEKPGTASVLEGVPASLPALAQSQSVQGRARRAGFDWPGMEGPLEKLTEEVAEFASATTDTDREAEFGDILFVIAGIAQRLGIDAEQALRGATRRFRSRFAHVEQLAAARHLDLHTLDIAALTGLWHEAKVLTADS